jgi:hypothetical protein
LNNRARRLVGPLVALMACGTVRADEPEVHGELCVEFRVRDEGGRPKIVSHRLKLKPDGLSSLAFQVEAIGDKRVRVTVRRHGEGPMGFASVEVVSKVAGEAESRAMLRGRGDQPLGVTSERVTVCYDRPDRWRLLADVNRREDGRLLATFPACREGKEVQAKRFSASFDERPEKVSVAISGVIR